MRNDIEDVVTDIGLKLQEQLWLQKEK
jgi:hypothetical protein